MDRGHDSRLLSSPHLFLIDILIGADAVAITTTCKILNWMDVFGAV